MVVANLSFEIHFDVDLATSDVIDLFQAGLVAVSPRFCETLRVLAHEGDRASISIDMSDSQALSQAVVRKGSTRGGTVARLSADSPPKHGRRFGSVLIRGKAASTFLTVRFDEHAPAMQIGDEWLWSNSVSARTRTHSIGRMASRDWIEQLLGTLVEHPAVLWGAAFDREEFAARNIIDTTYSLRAVGRDVRSSLPGLYWLNVFGARYVDLIGEDRLRNVPVHSVAWRGASVVVQLYAEPEDWMSSAGASVHANAVAHLGEQFFFDGAAPDRAKVAPEFGLAALTQQPPPFRVAVIDGEYFKLPSDADE